MSLASVHGCARCGGAHINKIEWLPLTRPIVDDDGTTWTHWALCPMLGEPILMRQAPKPNTPENPIVAVVEP